MSLRGVALKRSRTSWITAIGTLDIFLGALGILLFGLIIFGGIQINTALDTIDQSLQQASEREFFTQRLVYQATRTENELHHAQALILPDGIVSASLSFLLIIIGIGTLCLCSWSRWLSLIWSLLIFAWVIIITTLRPVEFGVLGWLTLVYPVTHIVCFFLRGWRQAFSRQDAHDPVPT